MARSAAALVQGFSTFDPALTVAGVIFDRVAGPSHYQLLEDALASGTRVRASGYLPRRQDIEIPERHLGLVTADEASARREASSSKPEEGESGNPLRG